MTMPTARHATTPACTKCRRRLCTAMVQSMFSHSNSIASSSVAWETIPLPFRTCSHCSATRNNERE